MPKRILPLTDIQVKNAKPKEKEYKLSDGGGLYLLITPSGGKLWRFKYRFGGVEKRLTFKTYPEISLADARHRREDARKLIANGIDPASIIKAQTEEKAVAETTFEKVAREWFSKNEPVWSESHCKTVKSRLERDVYPIIGSRAHRACPCTSFPDGPPGAASAWLRLLGFTLFPAFSECLAHYRKDPVKDNIVNLGLVH